jgi:NAD(P)-dependent dehydrogenase (short-subunit alcohol dehydrogenase family)
MLDRSRAELPGFDEAVRRQFLGLPTPSEVALAVAYLLSDAARRVTGTVLVIDGGFTC